MKILRTNALWGKVKITLLLFCLFGSGLWLLDRSEAKNSVASEEVGMTKSHQQLAINIPEIDRYHPEQTETALFALG